MNPAEELSDLVEQGVALASRYPEPDALARARARFTLPASLSHLGPVVGAARPPRPRLPAAAALKPGRPPRIAIVTPDITGPIRNGGIGTAYASLARVLAAAGHEVTVLYTLGRHCESGQIGDWVDTYQSAGIRLVPLSDEESAVPFYGPRLSFAAYQWLKEKAFDVVHFPEWTGTGFCTASAKRLGLAFDRTTICVGLHGPTVWHDLEDRRTVESADQLERDALERRSVELADVVVSPSQYLLQWLDAWGWATPARTYVQPNIHPQMPGIGSPSSVPAAVRPVEELVFFGRLESRKGLGLFCDAIDRLAARHELGKAGVTFLGKAGTVAGQDSLDYLRGRASRWTHPWRALVDRSQGEAIDYLTSRRALAVMPSLADNTPNTVLECLGVGIPFVATRVGGIPEIVAQDDHQRTLVPPDADALAHALRARLARGAARARPAVTAEDVRREWVAWHEAQAAPPPAATGQEAMRRPPLVSVCVATRDRPALLEHALESLRRQIHAPLEVVLVDDGSETAEASAQLDALKTEFDRRGWMLFREPRRFPGGARNTAALWARGRYLLFMDDDNIALPHEVETLVRAAEASGASIVTCGHAGFEQHDTSRGQPAIVHRWMPLGSALPLALFSNCLGDTNMLVRREAFFSAGGFDEDPGAGLVEDWTFLLKALLRGLRIEVVPEILYRYRVGPHGFGQTAPPHTSYGRPLQPFSQVLPPAIQLALFYAAGAFRRLAYLDAIYPQSQGSAARAASAETPLLPEPRRGRRRVRDHLHARVVHALGQSPSRAIEGEHLAAPFAAATPLATFTAADSAHFRATHQCEIAVTEEGLLLRSFGDEPQVLLPPIPGHRGGSLLVRIELSSPRPSVAQLFWKTPRLPLYCEQQSVRIPIAAGWNVRYVRLPSRRILGRLRFDPAACRGDFVLRRLDIRVAPTLRTGS